MVEGAEIANNARFTVDTKKYAGAVSFSATVKGDAKPEQLESAWYEQVDLLQNVFFGYRTYFISICFPVLRVLVR